MMALVDAGVPLKDTVVSCTASLVKSTPFVDVNHVEQSGGSPELVVSILPHSGEVSFTGMVNEYRSEHRLFNILFHSFSDCIYVSHTTISFGSLESSS